MAMLPDHATVYSCLSDHNYLLLIDARNKSEYNESHVITAKKAPKSKDDAYMVPYDAELECKQHVVVYDSKTRDLKDSQAKAIVYGKLLWEMGSRHKVKILHGGYEDFSAMYPFLRTQKIMFMPRELDDLKPYPIEIIPGSLYLGNWRQGNAAYIQKDLKIKAHINVCVEDETFFKDPGPEHLHIQVQDSNDADLFSHFQIACDFLDGHRTEKRAVLVFGNVGISRCATVIIAFLMHHYRITLEMAWLNVKSCLPTLRPNRAFVEQLSGWEEVLFGAKSTNIDDPNF